VAGLAGVTVALTGVHFHATATAEIGVAVLAGAVMTAVFPAHRGDAAPEGLLSRPSMSRGCAAITVALIATCLLLGPRSEVPPQAYFILASVAAGAIALQIASAALPKRRAIILAEIVVLALLLRAVLLFAFPSLYGTDTWLHAGVIDDWFESGVLLRTGLHGDTTYYSYPVTYLQTIAFRLVGGADLRMSMFSVITIPLALVSLSVYCIGRTLAGERVGLLAALAASFNQFLVVWGAFTIPTVLGVVLFSLILLLVARPRLMPARWPMFLIFTCALVWTHTISSFVSAVTLVVFAVALWAASRTALHESRAGFSSVVVAASLFGALMLQHWLYAYYPDTPFFERTLSPFLHALESDATLVGSPFDPAPTVWNRVAFLVLIVLTAWGATSWMLSTARTRVHVAWLVASLCIAGLMFSLTFLGIRNLIPQRWLAFAFVLAAPAIGTALSSLLDGSHAAAPRAFVVAVIVTVWAWFSLNTNFINLNTPFYDINARYPYAVSEQAAANRALLITNGPILADKTMSDEYFDYVAPERQTISMGTAEHAALPAAATALAVIRDYARVYPVAAQTSHVAINADLVGNIPWIFATKDTVLAVYPQV
jgi:hypothetical protein